MENRSIILIGMPGCGKTTLGRHAARKLGFEFTDLDDEIVTKTGKSINEIFAESGETVFRELETEVLREGLKRRKTVISTGGGIVTLPCNVRAIKESDGVCVFIDRPLDKIIGDIVTSERPLLKDGADRLRKLYSERYELYKAAADVIVINDAGAEDAAAEICAATHKEKESII